MYILVKGEESVEESLARDKRRREVRRRDILARAGNCGDWGRKGEAEAYLGLVGDAG